MEAAEIEERLFFGMINEGFRILEMGMAQLQLPGRCHTQKSSQLTQALS